MKRGVASKLKRHLQQFILSTGYNVYKLTEADRRYIDLQSKEPPVAEEIFGNALSRLQELRQRYQKVKLPIALHSAWASRGQTKDSADVGWGTVELRRFRDHNAYIFSYLPSDPYSARLMYFVYADSARRNDPRGLMQRLQEDGAFGCQTCEYPGIGRVSRDLLDSVIELNFLQRHLGVLDNPNLRILDIGAGYGRMAYRTLTANPQMSGYTCVDAVPESTFLSEFYLKHRGMEARAQVVPMDEVAAFFERKPHFDLALNIHSFSECTYAAVEWWLTQLASLGVRHLMIVPNESEQFLATEADFSKRDFLPLLNQLGYQLKTKEPVFPDPAVQELMPMRDHMFLFELVR